ncbi:MAG: nucleotidyltransferase family protein [Planctomycetota bacterium]|nr:nucleotidyltransferase family protein [Planctomycetota bacterium]
MGGDNKNPGAAPPLPFWQALFAAVLEEKPEIFRRAAAAGEPETLAAHLAAHGLAELAFDLLPTAGHASEMRRLLLPRLQANIGHRLTLESALREIATAVGNRGIPCAAIRGLGASGGAYRHPELRPARDIDLIVPAAHIPELAAWAEQRGYKAFTEARNLPLRRGAVVVEFSSAPAQTVCITRLEDERHTFPNLGEGWENTLRPGKCAGISWLAPPLEFLLSALHYAYKHRFHRHLWAMDLLLLGRTLNTAEREETARIAHRCRAEHILAQALDQAQQLAGRPVLSDLRRLLPARDPQPLRRALLRWCANHPTGRDAGYLLALVCSRSLRFSAKILLRMLFPPAADLVRNRVATPPVRWRDYLRHYLLLPRRLRRLWQR